MMTLGKSWYNSIYCRPWRLIPFMSTLEVNSLSCGVQDHAAGEDRKQEISEELRRDNPDLTPKDFEAALRFGLTRSGLVGTAAHTRTSWARLCCFF